jgi:hypothetical protein
LESFREQQQPAHAESFREQQQPAHAGNQRLDGLDFGLRDTRFTPTVANRALWFGGDRHFVCPLAYDSAGTLLTSLASELDPVASSHAPACGRIYWDEAGTVQGLWMPPGTMSLSPWYNHRSAPKARWTRSGSRKAPNKARRRRSPRH